MRAPEMVVLLIVTVVVPPSVAFDEECAILHAVAADHNRELETKAAVLRVLASTRDRSVPSPCVAEAIRLAGELKISEAIPDLVRLLDFSLEPEFVVKYPSREAQYPSIDALFAVGKEALPALLAAIADNQVGSVRHENALWTLMAIHREKPKAGVKLLAEEAGKTNEAVAKERLRAAIALARRKWCRAPASPC